MKLTKYILFFTALILFAACGNDEMLLPDNGNGKNNDTPGTYTFRLRFPETQQASSRALGETPDYASLNLFLAVFTGDATTSSATNFLTEFVRATPDVANITDDGIVPYRVTLSETDAPRVVHLIAIGTENLDIPFGPENVVIPGLVTTGNQDAYWQRVVIPCAINKDNEATVKNVLGALTPVPMLRNFAKVSVEVDAAVPNSTFELTGFTVINTIDRGNVAPWSATVGFADFLDGNNSMKPYDEVNYAGTIPSGWNLQNTDPSAATFDIADKYFYERPFSSVNRTYVIIRGQYNGSATDTYYKLDLGSTDTETGLFTYYNLLRNFNYHIRITSVGAAGEPTAQAAADGSVFNNFSASVETRNMLNISDGRDMMYVNFTRYVLVSGTEPIELRYRYLENIGNGVGTVNNDVVNTNQVIAGDVIESAEVASTDADGGWRTVTIYPKAPTNVVAEQAVTLFKPKGLSRTITFISRNPWDISNIETYNGTDDTRPDRDPQSIAPEMGAELTIFFDLPSALPEAMFPLEFKLESNRQNIENNPIGTLVVSTGPSMFEGVTDNRISYIKTISWADYDEASGGSNTVRCRFLCTTDLASLGVDHTETTVIIDNPYFNRIRTVFHRYANTN